MSFRSCFLIEISLFTFFAHAFAASLPDPDAFARALGGPTQNGYRRTIEGDRITYHSVNPAAREALIVRASDGKGRIAWETAPGPVPSGPVFNFAWLAAISGSKGEHRFTLKLNGEESVTFSSPADSDSKSFTVRRGGCGLTFIAAETDQFGDLFGYMFFSVPRAKVKEGYPIRLEVVGSPDHAQAWFMVFEHPLVDSVRIRALPAVLSTPDGPRQPLRITIENYSPAATAVIAVKGEQDLKVHAGWGITETMATVTPVDRPLRKPYRVSVNRRVMSSGEVEFTPVARRIFCLLPHSHTDIGYSDYQPVVERHHHDYLDSAIALSERTSGFPSGAQFKWNIEVMWPLQSYLAGCSSQQREVFGRAVRDGRVGLNGLEANIMMGLCGPEELAHVTDYTRKMRHEFRVPVATAMISDVPSYGWSVVSALAHAGIRYFSSGPNYMPALPDRGDRIGASLRTWGDKPAYWVSQSGADTLLFWMAGHGYSWFHGMKLGDMVHKDPAQIFDYVDELSAAKYPYELVQVRYTIKGDNGPPDADLPAVVRAWNERYVTPRFAIMTAEELFSTFERRYGRELPVISGDLTPHWEDGAASSPAELALNRRSARLLAQTESLAVQIGRPLNQDSVEAAWRDILLFNEHTWGAAGSVSEPNAPETIRQWAYKREFALSGARRTARLRSTLVGAFPKTAVRALDIVNPSSWSRSELVMIPDSIPLAGNRVTDERGLPVASQRLSNGALAVYVTDVPAQGRLGLTFASGMTYEPPRPLELAATSVSNGAVVLSWNPRTGGLTEFTIEGVNLVDVRKGGLNDFLYVSGRDPAAAATDSGVTVSITEAGPLVATVHFVSTPFGCRSVERTVTMAANDPTVEIVDRFDRERVLAKESIHMGFPFRVPNGQVRIDGGLSIVRPEADQLAGSNRDFFSASRWVDVSGSRLGITLAVPDAPFIEVGALTNESTNAKGIRDWRERVAPGTNLYSYVMNNYWHTNYRSDAEGLAIIEYRLSPHGPFDATAAGRRGTEAGQPLIIAPDGFPNNVR